jgi:hypothetical protein
VLASTVAVVEVVGGHYIALYDAETNGDAAFPVDCGASLTNPNDRYVTLDLTRDAGRILAGFSAAGLVSLAAGQLSFKKNAALAGFTFPMFDPADHVSPKSGLTVAGTVSIDGATAVSLTNAVSAVGGGLYKVNLAAGDTNGNVLCFAFSATGADPRVFTVVTQP